MAARTTRRSGIPVAGRTATPPPGRAAAELARRPRHLRGDAVREAVALARHGHRRRLPVRRRHPIGGRRRALCPRGLRRGLRATPGTPLFGPPPPPQGG